MSVLLYYLTANLTWLYMKVLSLSFTDNVLYSFLFQSLDFAGSSGWRFEQWNFFILHSQNCNCSRIQGTWVHWKGLQSFHLCLRCFVQKCLPVGRALDSFPVVFKELNSSSWHTHIPLKKSENWLFSSLLLLLLSSHRLSIWKDITAAAALFSISYTTGHRAIFIT